MPPKSARQPFKPPRPSQPAISTAASIARTGTKANQTVPQAASTVDSPSSEMEDDEPSRMLVDSGDDPAVPNNLLVRIVHEHFKHQDTRISKDAVSGVSKYIEVFVRETLARADWERSKVGGEDGGFLEVEDLEKLAPQLLLDF